MAFHEEEEGPYRAANARLVRYADDFVILARYMGPRIVRWIEGKLEEDLGLEVNRDKTSIVRMGEGGETLDFLGIYPSLRPGSEGKEQEVPEYLPLEEGRRATPGQDPGEDL